MLDVTDLNFDYQDKPLLRDLNFHLPAGAMLHLRGANGAGKTTLLRLLAGFFQPLSGEIRVNGQCLTIDRALYQSQFCYVGHKLGINPSLSVKENAFFDLQAMQNNGDLETILVDFELSHLTNQLCGNLSAGQQRRVALLRLALSKASIWLLDEPLVALDDSAASRLMMQIKAHRMAGGCVLLTSHQQLPTSTGEYLEYFL